MIKLGLIGYPLGHSFSKNYYLGKFERENIKNIHYDFYAIEDVADFPNLYTNDQSFRGFNVTIPHKQAVIPYLDELSEEAAKMKAVNCITISKKNGKTVLKGYNTDAFGFQKSLEPLLQSHHKQALVLGNGGAAKAVFFSLDQLDIAYKIVSRNKTTGDITYDQLTPEILTEHHIIINCSPVGTFPNIDTCPDIPYDAITADHLLYDLIYNPEETLFLKKGKEKGAQIKNGYEMLILQAEQNWKIWESNF
ncbi:shikimate dehydrogenase family protein [Sphingobacterium bovistauri]|uniref:Shikimate dehydrogenase n=1 Tax=Sphingobacterium bovistauri TaxID=2781959 RepID=A0ABS7Z6T3_9SPHI|nr:shikimate dehydrogenase [Sphingobacterium bovistauri]MCA5005896.1 shikimate dehydrogenase [Sphingobacterium bovistauri]